jgi:medium-chain acyl-[acyl-carrier-protein] hydrolase
MAWNFSSNDWLVIKKTATSPRARLLCLPHAGGSPATFAFWPDKLPPGVEVWAAQLPGRGRRLLEAPPTSIAQITETLLKSIHLSKEMPIALFGHSFGGWIAFELALQLEERGHAPLHLFVSGQPAPQLPDAEAPISDLPDRDFISEVGKRYGGLPEEVIRDEEMITLILPALRADFAMKESYRCASGPQLECPVSCFGGCEDRAVTIDELAAWKDRVCGTFNLRMFPGGHFFVDSARDSILKLMTMELESSLRKRGL